MRTYGPLGLTLTKPEAFTADELDELASGIAAIWNASVYDDKLSGPTLWMMVDILSLVREARDEARKEVDP